MSRSQKVGQKRSIKIANRSFEDMAKFNYLETSLTDENWVHEETNSRLSSGNSCYHLVQSLRSSRLLSKNVKVKIHRTIILPVVLCGCEAWYLTLREEHRLTVFENRVLRRIFGPKRDEIIGEKVAQWELHNLYSSPDQIKENEVDRACATHGRGEKRVQGFGGESRRKKTT
jgi:hypothetical protein